MKIIKLIVDVGQIAELLLSSTICYSQESRTNFVGCMYRIRSVKEINLAFSK